MLRLAITVSLLICACASSLAAVEFRPIMVTVVMADGSEKEYALFSNSVDKIAVGQKADDLKPASSVDWKRISHLKFGKDWRGIEYSKAMGELGKGHWQAAIDGFAKTVDGKYEKLQVESHLGQAQAYVGLKQFDEAVTTLDALLKKFPRHRNASEFMNKIGLIQVQKGDGEAAAQTATKLDGMKDWAPRNVAAAALLRAAIAKNSGKIDEAVATITDALTRVDGSASPDAMSLLVSDLIEMLVKAEKFDEAIKVGLANQWWPNDDADVSANVHFQIANAYVAKENMESAFHHAAIATSAEGVSPEFLGKAKGLAKQIVSVIKKANEGDEAKVALYVKALGNL